MHIVCNIVQQHVLLSFLNIIMAEISSKKYYNFLNKLLKIQYEYLPVFLYFKLHENINMNYKEMV